MLPICNVCGVHGGLHGGVHVGVHGGVHGDIDNFSVFALVEEHF